MNNSLKWPASHSKKWKLFVNNGLLIKILPPTHSTLLDDFDVKTTQRKSFHELPLMVTHENSYVRGSLGKTLGKNYCQGVCIRLRRGHQIGKVKKNEEGILNSIPSPSS